MEYCVNDIVWLQKSISSMEEKGLSPKGKVVATEFIKQNGEKAVHLKIDGHEADFAGPIEAANYIVEYSMQIAKRSASAKSVITGAAIGGAVSYINRSDFFLGVSVGAVIALASNYLMVKK